MSQVTIIITSYNKDLYLKEAIDSCVAQNYKDFELLIIDDGSTDKSIEIIESYSELPFVRILKQENKGVIFTRNRAIREAKGKFIVQVDGDDKLGPDFLLDTVPILQAESQVSIVYSGTEFIGEKSGVWNLGEYSLMEQLTTNLIVVTSLFRKSDYFLTKGYRDEFAGGLEDWDFWLSIIELGGEVRQLKKVNFFYRILNDSRNHSISNEATLKKRIFEKHTNLYLENGLDSTTLLWRLREKDEVISSLEIAKQSAEYKIGKIILYPYRFIQNLLR
jgi:glycosyltransferase involved in cell wall biosynthesis